MSTLFEWGEFTSHSGLTLSWKIKCDSLTDRDWATIARAISGQIEFRAVVGVPTGGLKFAKALLVYLKKKASLTLLVDDVLTTGKAMEELRASCPEPVRGIVLFARGPCPNWIIPIFALNKALW